MIRKQAALFPYCVELFPIVQNFEQLQEQYTLKRLIAPSGCGCIGQDAANLLNLPALGIPVCDTLNLTDNWDVLLVIEITDDSEVLQTIRSEIIEEALNAGKEVCYYTLFHELLPNNIQQLQYQYASQFKVFECLHWTPDAQVSYQTLPVQPLQTPVVLVGGLVEQADVFAVLIQLFLGYKELGYHPLLFTKTPAGSFCNASSVHPIFHHTCSEAEKICRINEQLYHLEQQNHPDVILIEAPDALIRYNDTVPNGFGIRTQMLTFAAPPDSLICCVPFDLTASAFIQVVNQDVFGRLGSKIDAVHASNIVLDGLSIREKHKITYTRTTQADVSVYLHSHNSEESDIPVLNMLDCVQVTSLIKKSLLFTPSEFNQCDDRSFSFADLLALLQKNFSVSEEFLKEQYWDTPLTGAPYYFNAEEMVFLLLEVEKHSHCLLSPSQLGGYQFNTISQIRDAIKLV